MAQEIELADHAISHEPRTTETNGSDTGQTAGTTAQRRLLRIGILTIGILCIMQAVLNISLWLAFHSKEDTDQFPFNSSVIAEACQTDQSQQNSTESCSCCNKLLKILLREYHKLKKERNLLLNKVTQLTRDDTAEGEESGSGVEGDPGIEFMCKDHPPALGTRV